MSSEDWYWPDQFNISSEDLYWPEQHSMIFVPTSTTYTDDINQYTNVKTHKMANHKKH
jgi:hypothetical protein